VTQGDRLPEVRLDSAPRRTGGPAPAQLADVLERVLDKGIVVAGDIQINLLDIELLTVRIRLLIASADKAKEMGIDWWQGDPFLKRGDRDGSALESRLRRLEERAGLPTEEERSER
jgi:Gas vesicle protein